MDWGTGKGFNSIKQAFVNAPALGLPDFKEPFILYMAEKQGTALGVLIQQLRYFSKRLDSVARGWPGCLWAAAATTLLVEEPNKLTFGQSLEVRTPSPHQVPRYSRDQRPPLANWGPPY